MVMHFKYSSVYIGGNRESWRAKQSLVCTRTQGKGLVTPRQTEPDLPVNICGSLQRSGLAVASMGTGALAATVLRV